MRRQALSFLLEALRPQRGRAAAAAVVLGGATLLEGVGIGLIQPTLRSLSGSPAGADPLSAAVHGAFAVLGLAPRFETVVAALDAVLLGRYGLEAVYQHLARVLAAATTLELRDRAYRNLMDLPLSFYYSRKTGDLISTLQASAVQAGAAVELILQAVVGVLFTAVYLGLGWLLSPALTVCVLGLAGAAYFLILPKFKLGFTQGEEEKRALDAIASHLVDTLGGIKTVKTFHGEPRHAAEFRRLSAEFQRLAVRIQDNRILAGLSLEPLVTAVLLGLIVVAVTVLRLEAASLLTFLYIVSRTLPRLRTANAQYLEILNFLPHALKVKELIDRHDKSYLAEGTRELVDVKDAIVLDSVTFRYPASERPALDRVSLRFDKGKMTALIGASGGGKTTLVNLLLKHHEPASGAVTVDGIDLRQISRASWHARVGLVEQDAHLFNGTIRDNIAYGWPEASEADVLAAAKLAHAHGFIAELPLGYATQVGERGMKLSGGQRQRVALARALLLDPQVLILDEATSALDSESERLIQRSIEELARKKTLIIIAHRLSTIGKADRLYVLEGGRVAEEGRPQDLLKEGGLYQKYRGLQLLD